MTMPAPTKSDTIGLVRPASEAHTLGISSIGQLLADCGYRALIADAAVCGAMDRSEDANAFSLFEQWLRRNQVSFLGFSYRLDPEQGVEFLRRLVHQCKSHNLLSGQGGPVRAIWFAGLPWTCELVQRQVPEVTAVFRGDETPMETLQRIGIGAVALPRELADGVGYDEARMEFGRDLIRKGRYMDVPPVDRSGYPQFGTRQDTLVARLDHGCLNRLPPLMRAHVGPYRPDRADTVRLFLEWTDQLARSGYLDVLSIGTSQLTQSNFGDDWGGKPNGGGVPINSPAEFVAVWQAARPMLVRTYAGTRGVPGLARMHEETLSMAWHALSLWWFSRIDGRGPNTVRQNLEQHLAALRYIASVNKPFEPNVPHHFAFRGGDDTTYVVCAVLAARLAKRLGIRSLVLQVMLNTPRYTWGVQDLAKVRAILSLVRDLEDADFRIILQPRAGLDYFSPDLDRAKAQLAAVTAMMDDIEPNNDLSPDVIHVVSYTEASHLADPPSVDESIKITRHALDQYRLLRRRGMVDDMTAHPEATARTAELVSEAAVVLQEIETRIPDLYTPDGLHQVLTRGYLAAPYLWECRDEFAAATRWPTRLIRGAVRIVDAEGRPLAARDRMAQIAGRSANSPEGGASEKP